MILKRRTKGGKRRYCAIGARGVRRSLPGVNLALAMAVHRIRELYLAVPEAERPDLAGESAARVVNRRGRARG